MVESVSNSDIPKVSVIIPLYNMESYIEESVNSVLATEYSNIEIVIVDDGSSDRSLAKAQELSVANRGRCNINVIHQENSGVSAARNNAIKNATGKYILPLDGDDKISPQYIGNAVAEFEKDPEVKVVATNAEFFGDKSGEWKLPEFCLPLLAKRNLICVSAMYRKNDWERVGGYCTDIKGLEDWDFWISMLKDGGKVVKLKDIGFYYRIRKNSKRISDRQYKAEIVEKLNERHSEFFYQILGGPLHKSRSWSKTLNRIDKLRRLFVKKKMGTV